MNDNMQKISIRTADGFGEFFWSLNLGGDLRQVHNCLVCGGIGCDDVVRIDADGNVIEVVERSELTTVMVNVLPFRDPSDEQVEAAKRIARHILETVSNANLPCQALPMPGAMLIATNHVVTPPVLLEHARTALPEDFTIIGEDVTVDTLSSPGLPVGAWKEISEALHGE